MKPDLLLLIVTILVALVFDFLNGFHDAANSIATVVSIGLATIAAALAPDPLWLAFGRLIAGIGLGAASPTCFSYVAEYSPKRIRGRATAFMQFIGGAWPWPVGGRRQS